MNKEYDFVIVGAGLAGLSAALELEKFERKVLVLDKEDRVGGRVKTDQKDGYLLDRGFQVMLSEYPETRDLLKYEELDLKAFKHGAYCFSNTDHFRVSDVHRNRASILRMAFSPVGSFTDKLKVNNLSARLRQASLEEIFARPERPTREYLKKLGFSKKIIARFFEPFFAGIFLERELKTSSRMFEFVYKLFSEGDTVVPARGMEEIPKQLKKRLRETEFRFHTEVRGIDEDVLYLKNGEQIRCPRIIIATEADKILPQLASDTPWQETATYYFSADHSPLRDNTIALNYNPDRIVNNFSVMSKLSPHYAPKGKHLISTSLTRIPEGSVEEVSLAIKNELSRSFGAEVHQWRFLKNYHISRALPQPANFQQDMHLEEARLRDGLYLAGDHLLNGSINAAMRSGKIAAQAAILDYKANA